jgi:gliding motility-associated lipoprotein GldD
MRLFLPIARLAALLFGAAVLLLMAGCSGDELKPKPHGFPRMELPPHQYKTFDCERCPFTFDYPVYGSVTFVHPDSCRFDIVFDRFGCKWHFTLEHLDEESYTYRQAFEKYRSMIYQHSRKGKVYEEPIQLSEGVGRFFELYGEVPTSAQFFFSDSSRYAVENSFYFRTALRNDSLAPVIDYMKQDLWHALETFEWREDFQLPADPGPCREAAAAQAAGA